MTLYSLKNQIVFHVYVWINVDERIQISFNVISWRSRCSNMFSKRLLCSFLRALFHSDVFKMIDFFFQKYFPIFINHLRFYGITKKIVDFFHMNSNNFNYFNHGWWWYQRIHYQNYSYHEDSKKGNHFSNLLFL